MWKTKYRVDNFQNNMIGNTDKWSYRINHSTQNKNRSDPKYVQVQNSALPHVLTTT